MKKGVGTVLDSDVEDETAVLTDSKEIPYIVGCLRMGEDHSNTIRWRGGDCRICLPDYIAKDFPDFIPNSQCGGGYIPCRVIYVPEE